MSDRDRLKKLGWLVGDPDQVEEIPLEEIPDVLGLLETVKIRLVKRFMAPSLPPKEPRLPKEPDRLLDNQEAAQRLSVKPKWLYDHFDQLPFGKRLADRTLRFSERGLNRWLERKAS